MQRLEQLKELKELESLIEAQSKYDELVEKRKETYKLARQMESEFKGLIDPSLNKSIPEKDVSPDYKRLRNYDKIKKPKLPKVRKTIVIICFSIFFISLGVLSWKYYSQVQNSV
jgi:hypothetical protein